LRKPSDRYPQKIRVGGNETKANVANGRSLVLEKGASRWDVVPKTTSRKRTSGKAKVGKKEAGDRTKKGVLMATRTKRVRIGVCDKRVERETNGGKEKRGNWRDTVGRATDSEGHEGGGQAKPGDCFLFC